MFAAVARIIAAVLLLLIAFPAAAQTDRDYTGQGADNNWSTPANWSDDNVPDTSSENAVIELFGRPSGAAVDLDDDFTIANLTIGVGESLEFLEGSGLTITGSNIRNSGRITFSSTGSPASLFLTDDVTLFDGGIFAPSGGVVRLGDNGSNSITSRAATPPTLINEAGSLSTAPLASDGGIFGSGQLGGDGITVVNHGIIRADIDGAALTLNPADDDARDADFDNEGFGGLVAADGGILVLDGQGGGTFSNTATAGEISARGGVVTHANGAILNQSTTSTLTRGRYGALDGGALELPGVSGGITTLGQSADDYFVTVVDLSGPDSSVSFGGTALEDSLSTIHGSLYLYDHTFNAANNLTVSGRVTIDEGGTLTTDTFTLTAAADSGLLANGTLEADAFLSGTILPLIDGLDDMTVQGNLTLDSDTRLLYRLGTPGQDQENARIDVTASADLNLPGDLVLDGELFVQNNEDFGVGTYTLMSFTGSLTNNGLNLNLPDGFFGSILTTPAGAEPGRVELVVAIPEPTSLALLGLGGMALLSRRRKRSVNPAP